MKKIISLVLFLLLFGAVCALEGSAVSYSEGMTALRNQFIHGETTYFDYACYSPVKDEDFQKYPLVVWLHGNSSGDYPGHQLNNCDIAMWSSEEYQSRFKDTGGAFIFLPRCPTNKLTVAWEGKQTPLKYTIDQFISENYHYIDTDRIYVGGYSMGGKMATIMASNYADFFAAAFLLSPVYSPSNSELDALANTPVWLAYCKNDNYPSLSQINVRSNWLYLTGVSNVPEKLRLSTFDGIYRPDGSYCGRDEVHNTWNAACYDFLMNDSSQYKDMDVVDGLGNKVKLSGTNGLISWLSEHRLGAVNATPSSGFLQKLINAIMNYFKSLVKIFGIF